MTGATQAAHRHRLRRFLVWGLPLVLLTAMIAYARPSAPSPAPLARSDDAALGPPVPRSERPGPGSWPTAATTAAPAPTTPAGSPPARSPRPAGPPPACTLGPKLIPTCGVLWGVAPGGHTATPRDQALRTFETKTGRTQAIYHAYHRGTTQLFPTATERGLAREPGRKRLLLLNWKPDASWAAIAAGDPATERFLDRLAVHIGATFREPFFLTVHHEPEDDVRPRPGSGYTATDFAAMFRHVIEGLRTRGATNVVSVLTHMAYPPWSVKPWFDQLYPGDDVVDWIAFDTYAYSEPGYGHGDLAEMLNRRIRSTPAWPGFYAWATARHPAKPVMVAEWGVWYSGRNPTHQARFYQGVGMAIHRFPRIRALVHFDTPHDQRDRDSRVDAHPESLRAYRDLGALPVFQVAL